MQGTARRQDNKSRRSAKETLASFFQTLYTQLLAAGTQSRPVASWLEYAAVTFLATVVLFYRLESGLGWWMDESWFSAPALDFARNGQLRMLPWAGARGTDQIFMHMPPAYMLWLALFFKLFGFSEFVARSASAVLGVLTTVGLYAALRWTTKNLLAAGVATLLLLSDPLFLVNAKEVRMEILVAGGAFLSYVMFLSHRPLLAGFSAVASFLAHPNGYVFSGVALLMGWVFTWPKKKAWLWSALGFATPVGIYIFVIFTHLDIFYDQQGGLLAGGVESSVGLWAGVNREWFGRYAEYWNIYVRHSQFLLLGLIRISLLLTAVAALLFTARTERRWITVLPVFTLMLFWILIPSNQAPRYLGIFLPFFYLWTGWLVAVVAQRVLPPLFSPPNRGLSFGIATLICGVVVVSSIRFLWNPPPPAEDPRGRSEMEHLVTKVENGANVFGHYLFWRDFANRDVQYFVEEAIGWSTSGETPETILRRLRPDYFLLHKAWLDPIYPDQNSYRRRIVELAVCLGEKLDTAKHIPYFESVSLFQVDWSQDHPPAWPSIASTSEPVGLVPLNRVAESSGASTQWSETELRFMAPQSRWDLILTWKFPPVSLAPGRYALEVTGRMIFGEIDFNVNDSAIREVFGRQVLTGTEASTIQIPFEVRSHHPSPQKVTVWNHAVTPPEGAPAQGVLHSLRLVRLDTQCQL